MESTDMTLNSPMASPPATKDMMQKVLAIIVTVGFFGVICFMLLFPVPETGKDVLLVLIGALGAAWTGIIGYFYGSSSGSAAKTAILATKI